MNELALFAGIGGGILASDLLGWRTVCAVEVDDFARSVLMARQNDGILRPFPIWDDVRTFDGRPWRGLVDVVSGGWPCQDISLAGRGAGLDGEKSGLYFEFSRIVDEVRPSVVFMENSPALTRRGLNTVLGDLASMGFDAAWGVLGADDVGALHKRKRIWILAVVPNTDCEQLRDLHWRGGRQSRTEGAAKFADYGETFDLAGLCTRDPSERGSQPRLDRVADGIPRRMDRLRTLGNAQVPSVAAVAFEILSQALASN